MTQIEIELELLAQEAYDSFEPYPSHNQVNRPDNIEKIRKALVEAFRMGRTKKLSEKLGIPCKEMRTLERVLCANIAEFSDKQLDNVLRMVDAIMSERHPKC